MVLYIGCLWRFRVSVRTFKRSLCSRASCCFKPSGGPGRAPALALLDVLLDTITGSNPFLFTHDAL